MDLMGIRSFGMPLCSHRFPILDAADVGEWLMFWCKGAGVHIHCCDTQQHRQHLQHHQHRPHRCEVECWAEKKKCCRTSFVLRKVFPYKMWDSTKWHMYTCVNLAKTYLNEWCISTYLYKMALGYLIIFLQYGRVLSTKIPVYNFQGCLRWFTIKWKCIWPNFTIKWSHEIQFIRASRPTKS